MSDDLASSPDSTRAQRISGLLQPAPEIIDRLGRLMAARKLVPFFGAGISTTYLGLGSRDLALELASKVGAPETMSLATVAGLFEERFGREALAGYLGSRLLRETYDDAKGGLYGQLLSLAPDVLYTTNQDNVFELASAYYGRSYKAVVTAADLRAAGHDESQLIKLHGDPRVPESLVFSARSYVDRMAAVDHPFDVKLKADIYKRELLFLGYSLRDENIGKMLAAVKHALGGGMAPGYLLAYEYDPSMRLLAETYGVEVIDPATLVVPGLDTETAFECVMKGICDATVKHQLETGIESLLADDVLNVVVLTDHELSALESLIPLASVEEAIELFRRYVDATRIPDKLKSRVAELFQSLLKRADPTSDHQMRALKNALWNLHLSLDQMLDAIGGFMALFNRRPKTGYDDIGALSFPHFPEELIPFAASVAVSRLHEDGHQVTDAFRMPALTWFGDIRVLDTRIKAVVDEAVRIAWPGPLAARAPGALPILFPHKGVKKLADEMMELLPKRRPR